MTTSASILIPAIDRLLAFEPARVPADKLIEGMRKALASCRARIEEDAAYPTFTETLTRKAFETVHDTVARYADGSISKDHAIGALAAVIDLTMGPIEPRVLDPICQALKDLRS